jgi:hypothetical protein
VTTLDVPSELPSASFALLFDPVFTTITSNCTAMREADIPCMRCLDRSQRRILVGGEADQVEIGDAQNDTYRISTTSAIGVIASVSCKFSTH